MRAWVAPMIMLAAACIPAHGRPLTAIDLAKMSRVSDPHISPDGTRVLYSVTRADYARNKYVSAVWSASLDRHGIPERLPISAGGASNPRWSPDGRAIYFLSGRSGSSQVWKSDASGDHPLEVTHLPLAVGSFELSPDGRWLVVSMAVYPDCGTAQCTVARDKKKRSSGLHGEVFHRLYVRYVDAWIDSKRNHLFSLQLNAAGVGESNPIALMAHLDGDTPEKRWGTDVDYDISPDGRSVFFSALIAGRREAWSDNFDIWRSPIDGSAPPVDLTKSNPAADAHPAISPDGRQLAYCAGTLSAQPLAQFVDHIRVMDLGSGATRDVAPGVSLECFGGGGLEWTRDGRSLVTVVEEAGANRLMQVDAKSGAAQPLTSGGTVADYDVGAKTLVFVRGSFVRPPELYRLRGDLRVVQLTDLAARDLHDVKLVDVTPFEFKGWNGDTVHGYVFPPYGATAGHRYPVAFLIHGGPQEAWDDNSGYGWNPQLYAGAGYAVVMINFHGSSGYGEAFSDAVTNHWGDRPLEDLQKGWSAARAQFPYLDGSRACAVGPSYGGYMVYWIAGVWNEPWRCLVAHDGVFDTRMFSYSSDIVGIMGLEFGGYAYQHPENYERFNPVDHVSDWSKPIMMIHSGRDYRVPLEQGLGAFAAAQLRGVPSELLYFQDEEHELVLPRDLVQWQSMIDAWLRKWTVDASGR